MFVCPPKENWHTMALPVEIQNLILYRYGGLEHKTAKMIKDRMKECGGYLSDSHVEIFWYELEEQFDGRHAPIFDWSKPYYEGGMSLQDMNLCANFINYHCYLREDSQFTEA
jgi:hypothetical protein